MHYHAVQERGYSYPTPHEETVSVASMATELTKNLKAQALAVLLILNTILVM